MITVDNIRKLEARSGCCDGRVTIVFERLQTAGHWIVYACSHCGNCYVLGNKTHSFTHGVPRVGKPVYEHHKPCIYTQVNSCLENHPREYDRWCGECTRQAYKLGIATTHDWDDPGNWVRSKCKNCGEFTNFTGITTPCLKTTKP